VSCCSSWSYRNQSSIHWVQLKAR